MKSFTVAIDREQLFRNVCQLSLYESQNMTGADGLPEVERYRISGDEHELYRTMDESALYELFDGCQFLFRSVEAPITVDERQLTLNGYYFSNLPINLLADSISEALTKLVLAKWYNTRGPEALYAKYREQSREALLTVKSRALSRNTNRITYRPF